MTFEASARAVRLIASIRFVLLALVCLAVAHDAIFAVEHGIGAGYAEAMRNGGHDGYWPALSVVVVVAGTVLGLRAAVRLGRLGRAGGRGSHTSRVVPGRAYPGYRSELLRLWLPLFVGVALAFALQENLEHLVGHGHLIGLGALIGPEYPLALPVIGLVALAAAALGALVRWRIALLQARIGHRLDRARPRGLASRRPAPGWAIVAALRVRAWSLVRLDAGRAPPVAA
jgi:hypothetical protein